MVRCSAILMWRLKGKQTINAAVCTTVLVSPKRLQQLSRRSVAVPVALRMREYWSVTVLNNDIGSTNLANSYNSWKVLGRRIKYGRYGAQQGKARPDLRIECRVHFPVLLRCLVTSCRTQTALETSCAARWPHLDFWPFDLEVGVRVACDLGYPCAKFRLPRPFGFGVRADVRDIRQTDGQTDRRTDGRTDDGRRSPHNAP